MTIKEAYELSKEKCKVEMGSEGEIFAPVLWKSSESGNTAGPFWVLIVRDIVIEVSTTGNFLTWFPATTEDYYPYFDETLKEDKQKVRIKKALMGLLAGL